MGLVTKIVVTKVNRTCRSNGIIQNSYIRGNKSPDITKKTNKTTNLTTNCQFYQFYFIIFFNAWNYLFGSFIRAF